MGDKKYEYRKGEGCSKPDQADNYVDKQGRKYKHPNRKTGRGGVIQRPESDPHP